MFIFQCNFAPLPITRPLQHLTIENVSRFEQCFFDYLLQRTAGQLRTLAILGCFNIIDPKFADRNRPGLTEICDEFERNLLEMLRLNRGTLEKLRFQENQFQYTFFQKLAEQRDLLMAPDLTFGLHAVIEPTQGYISFVNYMSIPKPHVEKLKLQFRGYLPTETFNASLRSFQPTLRHLTVYFAGDTMVQPFDLSIVQNFVLNSFIVRDTRVNIFNSIGTFI